MSINLKWEEDKRNILLLSSSQNRTKIRQVYLKLEDSVEGL